MSEERFRREFLNHPRDIRGRTPRDTGALESPPIELHWNGWRANTHDLQHHGWQFACNEYNEPHHMGVVFELAFRHNEVGCSGRTRMMMDRDRDRGRGLYDPRIRHDAMYMQDRGRPRHMVIDVDMAGTFNVVERQFANYYPVDMRPDYYPEQDQYVPLHRLPIFRRIQKEGIYLHEASMNEVLKFALDKQAPRQKEIRSEILKGNRYSTPKTELLLVS